MGLLDATALAALRQPGALAVWTLTATYPGSTIKRYAKYPVSSAVLGHFRPRVLGWGPFRRTVGVAGGDLEGNETTVEIADDDKEFWQLQRQHGRALIGSPMASHLAISGVTSTAWPPAFTGILGGYRKSGAMQWQLQLRNDDLALATDVCFDTLSDRDWPRIHPAARGKAAPLIWGTHSSANLDSTGMVPTLHVDTSLHRYLVCKGRAKSITNVYKDGVEQFSGFSIEYLEVNGRLYTVIKFTSSQGASAITCNMLGYETVGDGSGTLIEEPTDAFAHALANFVFNQYERGPWFSASTAPIDTTLFAAARPFFTARGYKVARRIAETIQAKELVSEWARSVLAHVFWTRAGKIAVAVEDPSAAADATVYPAAWVRWNTHLVGRPMMVENDGSQYLSQLQVQFCHGATQSKYFRDLIVTLPGSGLAFSGESRALPWSKAAA